jgi:type II secretory pathway component PulM
VTELIAWLVILGLALALVGIYVLYNQIKEHRRDTAEIMLQSNEMMLAHLKRLSENAGEPENPSVTVMVERRAHHRDSLATRAQEIA